MNPSLWKSFLSFAETRTETRIEWLDAPETWVTVVVIIPLLLLAAAWCYRGDQGRMGLGPRILMGSMRFLVLMALVLILFKPTANLIRLEVFASVTSASSYRP